MDLLTDGDAFYTITSPVWISKNHFEQWNNSLNNKEACKAID